MSLTGPRLKVLKEIITLKTRKLERRIIIVIKHTKAIKKKEMKMRMFRWLYEEQ